jgi:hypothetical protein
MAKTIEDPLSQFLIIEKNLESSIPVLNNRKELGKMLGGCRVHILRRDF